MNKLRYSYPMSLNYSNLVVVVAGGGITTYSVNVLIYRYDIISLLYSSSYYLCSLSSLITLIYI